MKIGWIGIGKMGLPMARRLAAAGHDVLTFARNDDGRRRADNAGLQHTATIADTVSGVDLVFAAVSDDAALTEVVAAPGGLAEAMVRGQAFVDTSTVSPEASAFAAGLLAEKDISYLRAPVSGSTATAEAGKLTIIVSGPRAEFDRLSAIFEIISAKQFHVGEGEQARIVKLMINSLVGATSALLAEALAFGQKSGVAIEHALDVIRNSAVASPLIEYKRDMIVQGNYEPAFTVAQMMKDFDLIQAVSRNSHTPMNLVAQIREQYEAAFAGGMGDRDFFVLVKEASRRAGL